MEEFHRGLFLCKFDYVDKEFSLPSFFTFLTLCCLFLNFPSLTAAALFFAHSLLA